MHKSNISVKLYEVEPILGHSIAVNSTVHKSEMLQIYSCGGILIRPIKYSSDFPV